MRPQDGQRPPADLRTDVAHPARIYDYVLGGKTNFAADRAAAEKLMSVVPGPQTAMRANRAFMHRVVRHIAGSGVHQFLDIGTGIPTSPNLHEIAQAAAPASRVVYVDNDPVVLVHARALLTSSPEGRTAYLDAALEDPQAILSSREVRETLDLTRPVGLTLIAVLHFVPEEARPYELVRRLLEPLPSGSFLAISHMTSDFVPELVEHGERVYEQSSSARLRAVDRAGMERFFDGLDLVDPGVVVLHRWRPDGPVTAEDREISMYGAVAVKP